MQHWEYMTVILDSNPMKAHVPKQPGLPTFSVEYLKPQLDAWGSEGWQLISLQPVETGTNGDILLAGGGAHWAHEYLCVFQRSLPDAS